MEPWIIFGLAFTIWAVCFAWEVGWLRAAWESYDNWRAARRQRTVHDRRASHMARERRRNG